MLTSFVLECWFLGCWRLMWLGLEFGMLGFEKNIYNLFPRGVWGVEIFWAGPKHTPPTTRRGGAAKHGTALTQTPFIPYAYVKEEPWRKKFALLVQNLLNRQGGALRAYAYGCGWEYKKIFLHFFRFSLFFPALCLCYVCVRACIMRPKKIFSTFFKKTIDK